MGDPAKPYLTPYYLGYLDAVASQSDMRDGVYCNWPIPRYRHAMAQLAWSNGVIDRIGDVYHERLAK